MYTVALETPDLLGMNHACYATVIKFCTPHPLVFIDTIDNQQITACTDVLWIEDSRGGIPILPLYY